MSTESQTPQDRHMTRVRLFRLILWWIDIAFGADLVGFCLYKVFIGDTSQLAQIVPTVILSLPTGALLIRSEMEKKSRGSAVNRMQ